MDTNSFHANPDVHKYLSLFFCCMDYFSNHTKLCLPDPSYLLCTDALLRADSHTPFRLSHFHQPSYPRYDYSNHLYYLISSAKSIKFHQHSFLNLSFLE